MEGEKNKKNVYNSIFENKSNKKPIINKLESLRLDLNLDIKDVPKFILLEFTKFYKYLEKIIFVLHNLSNSKKKKIIVNFKYNFFENIKNEYEKNASIIFSDYNMKALQCESKDIKTLIQNIFKCSKYYLPAMLHLNLI